MVCGTTLIAVCSNVPRSPVFRLHFRRDFEKLYSYSFSRGSMLSSGPSCNLYFLCPLPAHCVGSLCGLRVFHRPPPPPGPRGRGRPAEPTMCARPPEAGLRHNHVTIHRARRGADLSCVAAGEEDLLVCSAAGRWLLASKRLGWGFALFGGLFSLYFCYCLVFARRVTDSQRGVSARQGRPP